MSYCRFFEAGAYLIGTHAEDGSQVIECVSCRLVAASPLAEHFSASPQFMTYGELLGHIAAHRQAGHRIPRHVDEQVWEEVDSAAAWVPAGDLPDRPVARSAEDPAVREHIASLLTPIKDALAALLDDIDARAALSADPVLSKPVWAALDLNLGAPSGPNRVDLLEAILMELHMMDTQLIRPRGWLRTRRIPETLTDA